MSWGSRRATPDLPRDRGISTSVSCVCKKRLMYDREVRQILSLLRDGQEAEARAVFMKHLLAHCRALDQALGQLLGWAPNPDEYLWQVFKGLQHLEWFSLD
jgi:hypothetical protein